MTPAAGSPSSVTGTGARPGAYPLSLSMLLAPKSTVPLQCRLSSGDSCPTTNACSNGEPKISGAARNVFALISHVGEDCAGAVQFVTTDGLEALRSGAEDKVEWLDETATAQRLQILREDHAAWRLPRDTGQFNLAGAQPKNALLLQKGKGEFPLPH
ncbi:hypothetical protein [Bradyrhizobium sp. WSM1417]|uniref:hypothetical protein n=1 Tax=Bradyrhizobium sp. WSM1417 TaxID=754500 RepID=UPI0018DB4FFD|nr:hypothetical protein [Bradyrhizobium sp. WSM1417]